MLAVAITDLQGPPVDHEYLSSLARNTLMKQITVDSSMKKLSTEAFTLQIGRTESLLASFLLVLSFYGESLGGRGFATVLRMITLQAPLDRARGELPSDTQTLISHWEKFCGKIDEI